MFRQAGANASARTANGHASDPLQSAHPQRNRLPATPLALTRDLDLRIFPQPDDTTCGPTCLCAVYHYYGDAVPLERVIAEAGRLEDGGTLAVLLGCHALARGYRATIYTYNLNHFDPTWFSGEVDLSERLRLQAAVKKDRTLRQATDAYLDFLARGGSILFEELRPSLLRGFLNRGVPVLAGVSATYLYQCARELIDPPAYDDVRGEPMGHFVVLCGYDRKEKQALVADPLRDNPAFRESLYRVGVNRLLTSILLGVLTYDANLLLIEPGREPHTSPASENATS